MGHRNICFNPFISQVERTCNMVIGFNCLPSHSLSLQTQRQTVSLSSMNPSFQSSTLFTIVFIKNFFFLAEKDGFQPSALWKNTEKSSRVQEFNSNISQQSMILPPEFILHRYEFISRELPPKVFHFCLLAEWVLQGWLTAKALCSLLTPFITRQEQ